MSKKHSRACRYGAQCLNTQCIFKHPDTHIFTLKPATLLPLLNDQKQKDDEEADFLATMLHATYINDMADAIIYTAWDEDKPYAIETFPELGLFPTWNDAYDTLLGFVYTNETPVNDDGRTQFNEHSEAMEVGQECFPLATPPTA